MIEPVVEILALLLLGAVVTVLFIGLAVVGMLGLLAFRVVRKAYRVVGWLRWPPPSWSSRGGSLGFSSRGVRSARKRRLKW